MWLGKQIPSYYTYVASKQQVITLMRLGNQTTRYYTNAALGKQTPDYYTNAAR